MQVSNCAGLTRAGRPSLPVPAVPGTECGPYARGTTAPALSRAFPVRVRALRARDDRTGFWWGEVMSGAGLTRGTTAHDEEEVYA